MLEKIAKFKIESIEALNKPDLSSTALLDQEVPVLEETIDETIKQIKLAYRIVEDKEKNANKEKDATFEIDGDNTEFDLEAEIKNHPDSLFIKCFAIKANEPNDNGDYFGREELKKSISTFTGVPIFTNHTNNDVNQARGKVVHSWWDSEKDGIMIIARVDAAAYPQLARGIKEKYVVGTSMGCSVQYSLCSVCHNYAETPDDYCSHIRERKTRVVSSNNEECKYHDNGPDEECPLCGCKKNENKKFAVKNQPVFEYNYGIRFIENSFVVNPACHSCGVTEVIDPEKFIAKIAHLKNVLPTLWKKAEKDGKVCVENCCIKTGGQQEINDLQSALELLSKVSQTMLQQKSQIDLEFLSDLVKVMADLQTVTDELTEQGYGQLHSPGDQNEAPLEGEPTTSPPATVPPATVPPATAPLNPTPGGGSKVKTGPASSGIGTITAPAAKTTKLITKEGTVRRLKKLLFNSQLISAILKKANKQKVNISGPFLNR